MIAEDATDAIVAVGAGKQRVDLLDRRLSPAEPQLQHAAHWPRKRIVAEQLFDRLAVELLRRAALLLQPLPQTGDLAGSG